MASKHYIVNSKMEEKEWVIQMSGILKGELENNINNTPVCIFQLPDSVTGDNLKAYTPQLFALGPYHHFKPKLYQRQKHKLSEAQKAREQLKLSEFHELFYELKGRARDIRACYHEYLDMDDETLSCLMVIDGLFLLDLIYNNYDNLRNRNSEDSSTKRSLFNATLRDTVLLENQIPNVVLETLLSRSQDKRLVFSFRNNLIDFCARLSPIEILEGDSPPFEMTGPLHLLDALHQLVWLGKGSMLRTGISYGFITQRQRKIWTNLWGLLPILNVAYIGVVKKVVDLILSVFDILGISVPTDIFSEEKFIIPSTSQLAGVGLRFRYIPNGAIRKIRYEKKVENEKTKDEEIIVTLYLPVLKLNSNYSEVVIRNLLAYEATATPESPKFTRYIELMSGLIRSVSDVEVLKKAKAIIPENADNAEIVKLFSAAQQCVRARGESKELDEAMEGVNKYYNSCRKVKMRKLAKKYLFVSWQVLTVVALILVLFLMAMQTFCSIYSCPRLFKTN